MRPSPVSSRPSEDIASFRPGTVATAVWRHKKKAVATFLAVFAVGAAVAWLLPPRFRSEAKLFMRLGRENVTPDPTALSGLDAVLTIPQSRESEINSVAEILKTRALAERVVDTLGAATVLGPGATAWEETPLLAWNLAWTRSESNPSTDTLVTARDHASPVQIAPALRDRAVRYLIRRLEVSPVRKSNLVRVVYEGRSPEAAQAIVSKLVELYLAEHLRLNRSQGAHDFLTEQSGQLRTELTQAEQRLRDLKDRTGLASPEEQRKLLVERLARLEEGRQKNDALCAATRGKIAHLEKLLTDLPAQERAETAGFTNEGTDNMRGQLYGLQIQGQRMESKYTTDHPLLQETRQQVERVQGLLTKETGDRIHVTTRPNRPYQQAEVSLVAERPLLAALESEGAKLESQLVALRGELKTLNRDELEIAAARREIDLLEASYRRYAANREQARIDQSLEQQRISNVSLAQPATYEIRPVRPAAAICLGLSGLAGLLGAVAVALAADRRSGPFRTAAELQACLGVPVLETIPRWQPRQEVAGVV